MGEGGPGGGLVDPCKAWVPPPSLLYKCVVVKLGSKAGNFSSRKNEGEGGERD